jgi:ferric-dicitrate binding protein FerR (iron transport regulator)
MKNIYDRDNQNNFNMLSKEEKILLRASQYKIPSKLTKEEAYDKIKNKINNGDTNVSKNKIRSLFTYSAAAAVIIVLIVSWFIVKGTSNTTVIAKKGQHTEYILPDGSKVILNADSRISYQRKDFIKNRIVKLKGEAFFEVTKGNSFIIKTKKADIKVLGTSFNIVSRNEYFKVSCFTGKVSVDNKKQSVILLPNESVKLDNKKLIKYNDKEIEKTILWRYGQFYYENTSLKYIFAEIERQFDVKLFFSDIEERQFTGTFSNSNLSVALDIVCIPMKLNYEIKNNKVYIKEMP